MTMMHAKRLAPALVAVAALSLSAVASSAEIAQPAAMAQAQEPAAILAARDYLLAVGHKSRIEARITAIATTQTSLKIMMEREPLLEEQVAKGYAALFTAEELREAGKFFRTASGAKYFNFNIEMNTNAYTTADVYRNEVAKRFTPQERAEIFAYISSALGKKMQRVLPELVKVEKEAAEQWGVETQKEIDRALRAGERVS
jgi:hypothetical protein